ncbi:MAG: HD domain-containing protein [Candidatus Babeliales bacterium]
MQHKKIEPALQKKLDKILAQYEPVKAIAQKIFKKEGVPFIVGGAVRDLFLGLSIKDLDIEVHGLSLEELENILKEFGSVNLVGKVFGVLRLHNLDADWSVPRTDEPGRKPKVTLDPTMSFEKAFLRRDLTMNAMGINIITYELIDPFNGLHDLENGILRTPEPTLFLEDPLRFYRVMQFIGRFEMQPDKQLNELCKSMDISTVSKERISEEFNKLFLKSDKPSFGFRWLDSIGRLTEILPELAASKKVEQGKKWHPEGNVFEHTMQALDAAARLEYESDEQKLIIMYAALCHDLGKVTTTEENDDAITSRGHAQEGERLAKKMLKRIMNNKELIKTVAKLVHYHMQPLEFERGKAKLPAYKRLAKKLAPEANLSLLVKLAIADRQGRNPKGHEPLDTMPEAITDFIKKAKQAGVFERVEEPILQGKDLLDVMEPGPQMGKVLDKAYQIQIEKGIIDKQELKKRALDSVVH